VVEKKNFWDFLGLGRDLLFDLNLYDFICGLLFALKYLLANGA
jgi:hypothetical protein